MDPTTRRQRTSTTGLRVEGLSVRLAGEPLPILARVDLDAGPREVVGVRGRSGSGKSTLLYALAGLLPWARPAAVRGAVTLNGEGVADLDPGQRAHLLATCLDRPDAQLFLATPRQELAAARELHGATPLGETVVAAFALDALLDRRIVELSSGERQRVALAVALAAAPRPVLLDEPTVHLDAGGAAALAAVLREARALGGTVIVAEQAGWRLAGSVDRWLELAGGGLHACPPPVAPRLPPPPPASRAPVLEAGAVVLRRGGRTLLAGVSLSVHAGEIVLLSGPNGAGKSSLARVLAGHAAAAGGGLEVAAGRVRRPARTALLLPEASVQLFGDTVAAEMRLSGADATATAVALRSHRLEHLSGRAPWTLSRGERQRLVHAALDVLDPPLMVVDEPGQGLDPEDLEELAQLLAARAGVGRSYLIVSHREELAQLAHRHLALADGALVEAGGRA
jgi:energy-coupling factor transport system ATP-binding protein